MQGQVARQDGLAQGTHQLFVQGQIPLLLAGEERWQNGHGVLPLARGLHLFRGREPARRAWRGSGAGDRRAERVGWMVMVAAR
ncbi:hypothetical protein KAM329D_05420 [Aeromonas caviae]|nr:hypothetical protein KAM347_00430 [Aeromonas caviae]GJC21561.1 hypothetical protein KAM329D_05420 [Aeromonas caviae]